MLAAGDLREALRLLREAGLASIFCEGGATIASLLLREDLVDRLTLFYAPCLLGPGARAPFAGVADAAIDQTVRWRHLRTEVHGQDTMISLAR